MKILWLAPTFNHYKARLLNELGGENEVDLTVLSGSGRRNMGDCEVVSSEWSFVAITLGVPKSQFGFSRKVRALLRRRINEFDWVLVPAEKKNIGLLLYCRYLARGSSTRLFSYNHMCFKSKPFFRVFDLGLSWWFFSNLDKVIFYTSQARDAAVKLRLVQRRKAYFASNTIVINAVMRENHLDHFPPVIPSILFIGRLIPSKRLDLFLIYYQALRESIPNLRADVVGDGPESWRIEGIESDLPNLTWYGALSTEAKISSIMARASIVFVPGLSGLSINHALEYGKPYVTLDDSNHGPEISYLENDVNGLILGKNDKENISKLKELLLNSAKLKRMSSAALRKSRELSPENWVSNIKSTLRDEK